MRCRECEGCGNRFNTTETVLGSVARNSAQVDIPEPAVHFIRTCLNQADDPAQVVRFVHACLGAVSRAYWSPEPRATPCVVSRLATAEACPVLDELILEPVDSAEASLATSAP